MLRIRSRGSLSFADDVAEVTLREPAHDIAPTPSALAAGLTSATVGHELRAALGIARPTLSAGRSRPCHEARFPVRTCVRRPVATLEVGCPTTCLSRTNGGAEVVLLLDARKMTQDGLKRHETAVAELERQRRATAKALGGLGRATTSGVRRGEEAVCRCVWADQACESQSARGPTDNRNERSASSGRSEELSFSTVDGLEAIVAAGGAGATSGAVAFGAAGALATASTGMAIVALSGAAGTNLDYRFDNSIEGLGAGQRAGNV